MKLRTVLSLGAILAIGLCSCSDDEPATGGGNATSPDTTTNPNTGAVPSTPAEEKTFMEETATQLKQSLDPKDQAKVVNFGTAFTQEFGDFEFDGSSINLPRGVKSLTKAVKSSDWLGMTRAVRQFTYNFDIAKGIYEPDMNRQVWKRTGDSSDVIFRCSLSGQPCEVRIAPSDGTWTETVNGEWYDEETYEDYPAEYKFIVPKTLRITAIWGSETLIDAVAKTNYSSADKKASADVDARIANIRITTTSSVVNNQAIANAKVSVGNLTVIDAKAVLNGTDLANVDRYESIVDNEGDIHQLFNNGSASGNILGRVYIAGSVNDISTLPERISEWYDEKGEADAAASHINGKMKADFYLGGATKPSGNFFWQSLRDEYEWNYGYEEWYLEPLMHFNSDGSNYRVGDYFSSRNFGSVLRMYESLMEEYASYFGFDY